ncbi:hypothetical protein ACSYDW_04630 [Paeniglutamicibacter sp. R2-26]|uniref:hypothetical protein n=1 Tax=Paeniglutamicibacter sp. R2-26 TaxID=3144417 RepID=UPI003EE44CD0
MTALEEHPQHATAPLVVAMVLVAIIGLPLGLFGSIFGPYYALVLGAALAIVGMLGSLRGGRWSRVLLVFGIAVVAGTAIYILLGLLVPEGAGSGSGSACASGGSCE